MLHVPFTPAHKESATDGPYSQIWCGSAAPDGDALPWAAEPIGSLYLERTSSTATWYVKRKNDLRDDDWGPPGGAYVLSDTFTRAQMTDGGSTTGTIVLTGTIPAGAWVEQTILTNVTGFTGDTSATIQVGDGSDADRYTTGTPSVFTTAVGIDPGVPSGTKIHVTAVSTITVTITSNADFTNVEAGQATVNIHYRL
jgi:hypothetical protein